MHERGSRACRDQSSLHTVTRAIKSLKGNDREAARQAAGYLFNRYYPLVVRFAGSRLKSNARRVADEEDVAVETMCAFFEALPGFSKLENREDLKHLLLTIADYKARDQARFYNRQKRRVLGESVLLKPGASTDSRGLGCVPGETPAPDLIAMVSEEYRGLVDAHERLLAALSPELRRIEELRVQGYAQKRIAEELQCSLRTVERQLQLIRKLFEIERSRVGARTGEGARRDA